MADHNIVADSNNTILNSDAEAVYSLFLSVIDNSDGLDIRSLTGIEAFTALTSLDCQENQLTELNVSANTALTSLDCGNNELTSLNVANGNNHNFINFDNSIANSFNATANPNLRCIQVDDASNSSRNWPNKDDTARYSADCSALIVTTAIPDPNFEQALITLGYDSGDIDGVVLTANISGITSLDVSNNFNTPDSEKISNLTGIEAFTALTSLDCGYNQLTELNVSANTALTELYCSLNQLTELNVSANMALTELSCIRNELTSLDVSANTALTFLWCWGNQLTRLNVKNGNNINFSQYNFRGFNATESPDLICIQVDNVEWSTSNWSKKDATAGYSQDCSSPSMVTNTVTSIASTSATLSGNIILDSENVVTERGFVYSLSSTAVLTIGGADVLQGVASGRSTGVFTKTITGLTESTTYYYKSYATKNNVTVYGNVLNFSTIPIDATAILDGNFEQALVALGHDTNGENGYILNSDAVAVTRLDVADKRIVNLTGIEAFTSLTYLRVSVNPLLTLDVSKNTVLTVLECTGIGLTTLNVSANTALMELDCQSNSLTMLDVSANTALTILSCNRNKLTSLDVLANKALTNLDCWGNKLTELNVSTNTALTRLYCAYNKLTSLNVKNGNNENFIYFGSINASFNAAYNLNLRCIQVDDVDYSTREWTNKDVTASYSVDCSAISITTNPVSSSSITPTSATLVGNIFSDGGNTIAERGFVYSSVETEALTIENTSATKVTSGMGIGDFSEDITGLTAGTTYYYRAYATNDNGTAYAVAKSFNTIVATTILDPNFEQALIDLGYDYGEIDGVVYTDNIASITFLNVSRKEISNLSGIEAFTSLTYLNCGYNSLTTLDVSGAMALTNINCSFNQLTALNVSTNTALKYLFCNNNSLDELNVSANTVLASLACYNNSLDELNVSTNTRLTSLICNNNSLDELNISLNTALTVLNCSNNPLGVLNVSANTVLTTLNCSNNSLDELNVSTNTALTSLSCNGNSLSTLDVSENTNLTTLICRNNSLSVLDVLANTALTTLSCRDNSLSTLNVSENTALTVLYCNNNQLTSLNVANGNNHNFIYRNLIALSFNATGNADLMCIQVDNVDYSTTNWTNKDATTVYSIDCTPPTIMDMTISSTGDTVTMQTSEAVTLTNVDNEDFTVTSTLNGVITTHQVTSITSGSIVLTVTPAILMGATVSVSYDSTQGNSMEVIADSEGNPMSSFTMVSSTTTQALSLNAEWNLVGFNIEPTDNSMSSIFAPLGSSLVQINSQTQGYKPGLQSFLNTLTSLENARGYYIRLNTESQITLRGTRVNISEVSLPLSAGWNLISYPSENTANVKTALSNISQYVVQVNSENQGYKPTLSDFLNTLSQLEPKKGYWIKVLQDCTLTYAQEVSNSQASTTIHSENRKSLEPCDHTWGNPIIKPGNGTTAFGIVTIDGNPVTTDDVVGVFVGDELRAIGVIAINEGISYMPLTIVQGIGIEALTFKVWDKSECKAVPIAFTINSNPGETIGNPSNFLPLAAINSSMGNKDFKLAGITISPNPTTDILNITAKEKADYKLLNIRGQILKKGVLDIGKSKINISSFAKGIYFLNLKMRKGSFTRKIVKN